MTPNRFVRLAGATLLGDVRYVVRRLARSRTYSAIVIGLVALSAGTLAGLASVAHRTALEPLPFDDPAGLVSIIRAPYGGVRITGGLPSRHSSADVAALADATDIFRGVAAATGVRFLVGSHGKSRVVSGEIVAGDYFQTLGASPALGRLLVSSRSEPNARHVVVSHRLWHELFGASGALVEQTISIGRAQFTISGVAGRGFHGIWEPRYALTDFWVSAEDWSSLAPIGTESPGRAASILPMLVWARLQPAVALEIADARLRALSLSLETVDPSPADSIRSFYAAPIAETPANGWADYTTRTYYLALAGVAVVTCVLAAVALHSLGWVVAMFRRSELWICNSLGASVGRLRRLAMLDAGVLVGVGTGIGLAAAAVVVRLLESRYAVLSSAAARPVWTEPATLVVITAFVVVAVACLAVPALWAVGRGRSSLRQPVSRLGGAYATVAATLAITLVVLVAGSAFVKEYASNVLIDPGFDDSSTVVVGVDMSLGMPPADPARYVESLRAAVAKVPGVRLASAADSLPAGTPPMGGLAFANGYLNRPQSGETARPDFQATVIGVDEHYFDVLGVELVAGQRLTATGENQAIVSAATAKRLWGGATGAVGRTVWLARPRGKTGDVIGTRVVGVSRDTALTKLTDPTRLVPPSNVIYCRCADDARGRGSYLVATVAGSPTGAVERVVEAIRAVDPEAPVSMAGSVRHVLAEQYARATVGTLVLGSVGAASTVIAGGSVAGTLWLVGLRRRRELAIRSALGASRGRLWRPVLRALLLTLLAGSLVGAIGVEAFWPLFRRLRYIAGAEELGKAAGIQSVIESAWLLWTIALAAAVLPLRRIGAVDAWRVLKED